MPDLATATQELVHALQDLNKQAEKFQAAKRREHQQHESLEKEHDLNWARELTDENIQRLRNAQAAAGAATQDANREQEKLEAAVRRFNEALAAYMTAIYQTVLPR